MAHDRALDLVVFGATGFTGKLAAEYLAARKDASLRWAIAGRSKAKLEEVKRALVAIDPACSAVEVIEARSDDPSSLAAMTAKARVVLTTVGPYAEHGEPLVEACVKTETDYVDITGEPAFVDRMLARWHVRAEAARIRVVSCCGFDSIPHDLGAYYTVRKLPSDRPITVEGFVRARGGMSGGTWHSAIGAFSNLAELRKKKPKVELQSRKVGGLRSGVHYERRLGAWAAPLPTIDPQVVLRSARALAEYGPDFKYGHFAQIKSALTVVGGAVGIGALLVLAQIPPAKALLLKVKKQGEGPSEEERKKGWFQVTFLGRAGDVEVKTRVSGGEPGYSETAKMVSESALCLAFDRDGLPKRYGVITTAMAMGEKLQERLEKAGMKFETL